MRNTALPCSACKDISGPAGDTLVALGTGAAMVTEYYNTCFVLRGRDGSLFLTDGGGGGGIMGLGGYYMGLNMSGSFSSSCWINGYGWIAVALVIFANWNPALAILGTFVFGFFSTLRVAGSSLAAAFPAGLGWLAKVPTQLYQALPFLITAVVLVATSVRKREGSGCPAALGLNYFREER